MKDNPHIHLISPATGGRLLRIEDAQTGLCLERRLDPDKPLLAQKARLLRLFEAMLANELAVA